MLSPSDPLKTLMPRSRTHDRTECEFLFRRARFPESGIHQRPPSPSRRTKKHATFLAALTTLAQADQAPTTQSLLITLGTTTAVHPSLSNDSARCELSL